MSDRPLLRIGELARRAGIPPATLRAWERRYGVVDPSRTESGYRLYSEADERRVKAMVALITEGAAPAEAARRAVEQSGGEPAEALPAAAEASALLEHLADFDEQAANRLLDAALATYSVPAVVEDLILPALRRMGELWAGEELTVGQEHFASNVLRGRVIGMARGWGAGSGPLALLACPPGEGHDLGLACFGLLLRHQGWRIAFLGTDTPLETLEATAQRLEPDATVVAVTAPAAAEALTAVEAPLVIPGSGFLGGALADEKLAAALGLEYLGSELGAALGRLERTRD